VRTSSIVQIARLVRASDFVLVNGGISLRVHPIAFLLGLPFGAVYVNHKQFESSKEGVSDRMADLARLFLARRASINIFLSKYAAQNAPVPTRSSYVVRNTVDKEMQQHYNSVQKSRSLDAPFLFAGRIIRGKGIFVLARALEYLDGEISLRVIIAGEGRDEALLRKRTEDLETIDVAFAGRLDSADLVKLYQEARALLVPSTTHKEGNPLVIAEAIYAGTPVIASDQPPMVESVSDAGVIVTQNSAQELADAIRTFRNQPETYASRKEQAEYRSDLFGFDKYRKQMKSIFGVPE
jgi:glycosyltransferase involved in cell wall biosynthesis